MKNKIRIIIAEDQKIFRDAIIPILAQNYIQTIAEVNNGKELLKVLNRRETKVDVVLLDIEMPEMDGSETLDHIKRNYPDAKVIMLTQYSSKEMAKHFISRGASAYIDKGNDCETLINAIKSVHGFGFYYSNFPEIVDNIFGKNKQNFKAGKSEFSNREKELIPLLCAGLTSKEAAAFLSVQEETIEFHRKNILKKTNVRSTVLFIKIAMQSGFRYFRF